MPFHLTSCRGQLPVAKAIFLLTFQHCHLRLYFLVLVSSRALVKLAETLIPRITHLLQTVILATFLIDVTIVTRADTHARPQFLRD